MQNIIRAMEQANKDQIDRGMQWYDTARAWSQWCSNEFGLNIQQVASMIAVMSPRNRWEWNLQDVINLLNAIRSGRDARLVPCHSFNCNKYKAIAIARGEAYEIKSKKVGAFIDNITDPCSARVTVDVWAYRVYLGDYTLPVISIAPKLYDHIEAQYLEVARLYDLRGYQLQAITWSVARDTGHQFNEIVPDQSFIEGRK
jgi:hypothetical protein